MSEAPQKILCVFGTRPEAIKMAPIIHRLAEQPEAFETRILATAQHREMLDQVLRIFAIRPDRDLNIMQANQTLAQVTSRVLNEMVSYLEANPCDVVLAQGDTTTVMATAMACFYTRTRFGHVEAGLRTRNLHSPYPEEFNRKVAGILGDYHFAPTRTSATNLLADGTDPKTIHVTGNSVIDALFYILAHTQPPPSPIPADTPYVLMTCHRRENFGERARAIFETIREVARRRPDLFFWYPVHPNPNVKVPAHEILGAQPNVLLTEPLDYVEFVHAMSGALLMLSDSGGVQEEAPSLGKPVLVLRDDTERPEGVEAGTCRLVGADPESIRSQLDLLLDDSAAYKQMARTRNPYGDGKTAGRIADILRGLRPEPWE